MNPKTTSSAASVAELMPAYSHTILMLKRPHRRLMDAVTDALDRAKISHVNAVQAIMLYNIADQELTISDLRARDCYTGSNRPYNVKKGGSSSPPDCMMRN